MPVSPISRIMILPSYIGGFMYAWDISGEFDDPAPWRFIVQKAQTNNGPWENISPELENVISWTDEGKKHLYGKSNTLYFRVTMQTPNGEYSSAPVQPYGDLPRREWLLAREIMRRESLRARVLSGIECDLYVRSTFGPRCTFCIDPITGDVRDSNCKKCFGTGRYPAYFGPQKMMLSFSPDVQHNKVNSNDGTHEMKSFEALTIGSPVLKKGDVFIDRRQDKRYVVGMVSIVSEVRRIPCLQKIGFDEAPISDPIYKL